jgi:uncharacterized LabA/DUF88 family protein
MKVALLIDGGFLRACTHLAHREYNVEFVDCFSQNCIHTDEYLFRIMYYDAPRYSGNVRLPVSGAMKTYRANDRWLSDLAKLNRFAVRKGNLAFRGWKPKVLPVSGAIMTDADFAPIFEQKGVDMRIGLDIATFAERRSVERIIVVSGDTDMVPALKQARKSGLEVATIQLPSPANPLHDVLKEHSDLVRLVEWPLPTNVPPSLNN